MQTTNQLLDVVKARYGLQSDNALAARLGLTRAQVSRYRNKGDALGEDTALKVSKLLDLDPGYVLACAAFERAKTDGAKSALEHVADLSKRFGAAAALLLLVAVPAITPTPANAAPDKALSADCILCQIVRRFLARVSSLASRRRFCPA